MPARVSALVFHIRRYHTDFNEIWYWSNLIVVPVSPHFMWSYFWYDEYL